MVNKLLNRSASDVGFMNSRPMRPGSSQGFDLNEARQYRVHSPPVRNNVTSAFDQQRVLSPAPGENPIAAQLRGSQANLQQALRMHEDIARQVIHQISLLKLGFAKLSARKKRLYRSVYYTTIGS